MKWIILTPGKPEVSVDLYTEEDFYEYLVKELNVTGSHADAIINLVKWLDEQYRIDEVRFLKGKNDYYIMTSTFLEKFDPYTCFPFGIPLKELCGFDDELFHEVLIRPYVTLHGEESVEILEIGFGIHIWV